MILNILLEGTIPAFSLSSVVVTLLLGVLAFLSKDAYNKVRKEIVDLNEAIDEIKDRVEIERSRSDKEMRIIDSRISELHINILSKLDEIKDKFQEFRK